MKQNINKRWRIEVPCSFCAILIVQALLRAAGVEDFTRAAGFSFATFAAFAVWACCFYVVERIIKFALWAVMLVVAPGRAADMP